MTVTTMTFPHASPFDAPVARLAAVAVRALRSVATCFQAGVRSEPKTAEELLDWAAQYEATQPSYADDLRAAARQYQASH
ncbi:MAG: hypothetical protein AB9M53_01810 [Leptothrix sp. (in: b-proteobacteria)]